MQTNRRIFFRADGNAQKGLGHVYRSLALAHMLKEQFQCHVLIRTPSSALQAEFARMGIPFTQLDDAISFQEEAALLAADVLSGEALLVLDGYEFDTAYQRVVRPACLGLVCIDDIHAYPFLADVIINPASTVEAGAYVHPPESQLLLGPSYALLRPPFLEAARHPLTDQRSGTAFICMGGTDLHNYTLKAIEACEQLTPVHTVYAVLGSAYAHHDELEAYRQSSRLTIEPLQNLDAEAMVHYMQQAAIMICAASTVSYECICAGGALYVVQTYDNQQALYQSLMKAGVAWPWERLGYLNGLDALLRAQRAWMDGCSPQRLQKVFDRLYLQGAVSMRLAGSEDLMTYFHWANDQAVRANSIQQAPIPLADHQQWFERKLKDPHVVLCLAELHGQPVGQVRLDRRGLAWWINYSIDAAFRGRGLGKILLKKAIELLQTAQGQAVHLMAWVKPDNIASLKVFEQLNFQPLPDRLHKGSVYKAFEKHLVHELHTD